MALLYCVRACACGLVCTVLVPGTWYLCPHAWLSFFVTVFRLMDERKGQENFQLIVITHDERFAQLIGKKQFADHYYRVSKDDS